MLTFFHPEQLLHYPRTYLSRGQMRTPQEVPERAQRLLQAASNLGFEIKQPADNGMTPIASIHDMGYLRFLKSAYCRWKRIPEDWGDEVMSNIYVREPNALRGILAEAARYLTDGSCPVGESTWRSAYWSAQSAIAGAEALLAGSKKAYALCRPPGHHTRPDGAGGFCYLNNTAIGAQVLRKRFARVAILDTDMHHGQGVQEIFYRRRDVFYASIHGDTTNFYPVVTGFEDERGEGDGRGYNLNLPMPHGSSEAVFFEKLDEAISALQTFEPEAFVLALGFDIYREDPQAKVAVSSDGFRRIGEAVNSFGVPTLVVQEGGYYLDALEQNARQFFRGLGTA